MKFKNLTFILAVLLIAAVALGSVSAAEDIADDVSLSDDAEAVSEIDSAPEVVSEDLASDEVEEETTTYDINASNWESHASDFESGNAIFNFNNETYQNFAIKVGSNSVLNGNGATIYGNHSTVFDIANTQGVTISGFNIFVNDQTQNGIAGNFVYDANIYNNTIQNGDDGINIYRDWNNISIHDNIIYNMLRDGISLANPTHTNLSTLNGAYIYDNTVYDSIYGIFVGGNFNGEIYNNNLYQLAIGMQFAGKPQAGNGTLIAYVHDNNISAQVGIDMCHPGVLNFTLARNMITGTNMSINTNDSFSKKDNGGIYLYDNTINGDMSTDFINSITEAVGNNGTGAYNNLSNEIENGIVLLSSKNLLGDAGNNVFDNGDFSNELEGWTCEQQTFNNNQIVITNPSMTTFSIVDEEDEEHGYVLDFSGNYSSFCVLISQEIDLTNLESIAFDAKVGTKTGQWYGLVMDDDYTKILTPESKDLINDQAWHTYNIPKSVFSEYEGTHTVRLLFVVNGGVFDNYKIHRIDNIIGIKSEPAKTGDDIQNLINDVEDGGVIDLGENCVYEIADGTTFTLDKKVTVKGNNVTIKASGASQGGSGALFTATKAGTSFDGITFINTDGHKAYGEAVSGYAIQLAIENGTVNNCAFIDWSSGVYGKGAAYCLINNSYFNGSSELVTGAGKGEKGTKAINLMGSHDITVTYCTFEGQVLDGISIASNSGHNIMTDNTFIDNVYAIYFGGASTEGCVIANNSFIRCGYCPDVSDEINKKVTVLSTQKACNGFIIADNSIEAVEGSTFIIAEAGNTAHGYPSTIGDINITGNTLEVAEGATPETITFVKIVSNEGELNPYAPINISGNTIAAGVTPVKVWYADWGSEDDPVIPAADPVVTSLEIVDVSTATKKVTVKLVDISGEVLDGETISYSINGGEVKTTETDADGLAVIDASEDGTIAIAFAGNDEFKEAETSIQFTGTVTKTNPVITAGAMTATAKVGKYYSITLKDSAGNALVGENVTFYYNGQSKTVTTDEKGIAKLNINLAAKGNYPITISYLGNDYNNAAVAVKNIKVNVQKTKAVFKKATLKVKKAKKVKFTLKDASGKAIKGKKITIKVNGKTFSAKTNAKGVASIKVKVAKKGKFTAKATFAGDNTYKKITKKAKFTVK